MLKLSYEVEVLVNGKPVKEYTKDGNIFIEGKKGSSYSIKIKNNSFKRILAVPTVDGLSVIDGKIADYNSRGYIISGFGAVTIDGWRKSDHEVASFVFSNVEESYSNNTGKAGNEGIIGVLIFEEKIKPITQIFPLNQLERGNIGGFNRKIIGSTYDCLRAGSNSNNIVESSCFSAQSFGPVKQEVGTGWGENKQSEVISVDFEEDKSSMTLMEIRYNSRKELEKMGIDFGKRQNYINVPLSFPGEYCKPPLK